MVGRMLFLPFLKIKIFVMGENEVRSVQLQCYLISHITVKDISRAEQFHELVFPLANNLSMPPRGQITKGLHLM